MVVFSMFCYKCGVPATVEFKSFEDPTKVGGPLIWRPSCMECVPKGVSCHALDRTDLRDDPPHGSDGERDANVARE